MQELSLLLSKLIASIYYYVLPKTVEVEKIITIKDPSGLIKGDIEYIKKFFGKPIEYQDGITLEQVARKQGQLDVVRFIEKYKVEGPKR
jgi:hypothetical protein